MDLCLDVPLIYLFLQAKYKPRHSIYHTTLSKGAKFNKYRLQTQENLGPQICLSFLQRNVYQEASVGIVSSLWRWLFVYMKNTKKLLILHDIEKKSISFCQAFLCFSQFPF